MTSRRPAENDERIAEEQQIMATRGLPSPYAVHITAADDWRRSALASVEQNRLLRENRNATGTDAPRSATVRRALGATVSRARAFVFGIIATNKRRSALGVDSADNIPASDH